MSELTDLHRHVAHLRGKYGRAKRDLNSAKRRLTDVANLIPRLEAGTLDLHSLLRELKRLCRAELYRPVNGLPVPVQRKDASFRIRKNMALLRFYTHELERERCPADSEDLRAAIEECYTFLWRDSRLLEHLPDEKPRQQSEDLEGQMLIGEVPS